MKGIENHKINLVLMSASGSDGVVRHSGCNRVDPVAQVVLKTFFSKLDQMENYLISCTNAVNRVSPFDQSTVLLCFARFDALIR